MRKIRWNTIWKACTKLPSWISVLAYATAFTLLALSVIAIVAGRGTSATAWVIYTLTCTAFVFAVFVTVGIVGRMHSSVLRAADKFAVTRSLKNDYKFRTIFFGACSFIGNVAYTVFLCWMALYSRAFWYWGLAGYYILLTSMRGGVLIENHKNERRLGGNLSRLQKEKVKTYKNCGVMLLALTLVLSITVGLTVFTDKRFPSPDGMLYAFAVFAIYRMAAAIVNVIKGKQYADLVVRAVRNINFATALVSVLTLQTALLDTFAVAFGKLWNALSGGLACGLIVMVGVYMIVYSNALLKKQTPLSKGEDEKEEQEK